MTQITDYDARTLDYGYNDDEQVTSMNSYFGHTTSYTYTSGGRLSTITAPGNKVWSFNYNALGQPTSYAHANGMTTEYEYVGGNPVNRVDPLGLSFEYALEDGNLVGKPEVVRDPCIQTCTGAIGFKDCIDCCFKLLWESGGGHPNQVRFLQCDYHCRTQPDVRGIDAPIFWHTPAIDEPVRPEDRRRFGCAGPRFGTTSPASASLLELTLVLYALMIMIRRRRHRLKQTRMTSRHEH